MKVQIQSSLVSANLHSADLIKNEKTKQLHFQWHMLNDLQTELKCSRRSMIIAMAS